MLLRDLKRIITLIQLSWFYCLSECTQCTYETQRSCAAYISYMYSKYCLCTFRCTTNLTTSMQLIFKQYFFLDFVLNFMFPCYPLFSLRFLVRNNRCRFHFPLLGPAVVILLHTLSLFCFGSARFALLSVFHNFISFTLLHSNCWL